MGAWCQNKQQLRLRVKEGQYFGANHITTTRVPEGSPREYGHQVLVTNMRHWSQEEAYAKEGAGSTSDDGCQQKNGERAKAAFASRISVL